MVLDLSVLVTACNICLIYGVYFISFIPCMFFSVNISVYMLDDILSVRTHKV